jgi:tetratricopeptide (TPR) repeat protein
MWAERLLASPSMQSAGPPRVLALQASGLMAVWQGEQETGLAKLKEALAFWERQEDAPGIATMSLANGIALINMGRDSDAQPMLEYALTLFKELNSLYFQTFTLVHLGNAALGQGKFEQANIWLDQAYAQAQSLADGWTIAFALNNKGEVARTQGRYLEARSYYEDSESILRRSGDQGDLARLVHTLGYIAQHEDDYVRAEKQFRDALAMFRRLGNRRGIAECMAALAGLKATQGDPLWGATMLSAAEALLHGTGGAWWPADRVEIERNREFIRSALGAAEFAKAWEKGRTLTLDQALTFVG